MYSQWIAREKAHAVTLLDPLAHRKQPGRLLAVVMLLSLASCGGTPEEGQTCLYHPARWFATTAWWSAESSPAVAYLWRDARGRMRVSASSSVARLSDGRVLALGSGRVLVYRTLDEGPEVSWQTCKGATSVLPIEELGVLAVACHDSVWLQDQETGAPLQILRLDARPVQVAADETGTRLYVATRRGLALFVSWRTRPKEQPWQRVAWQETPGSVVLLGPDGARLGQWAGTAAAWTVCDQVFLATGVRTAMTDDEKVGGDAVYHEDVILQTLDPDDGGGSTLNVLQWSVPSSDAPLGQAGQLLCLPGGRQAALFSNGVLAFTPGTHGRPGPRLIHLAGRPAGLADPEWFGLDDRDAVLVWDQTRTRFTLIPADLAYPR